MRCHLFAILGLITACGNSGGDSAKKQEKATEPARTLAGVYPENFKCDSIITPEALATLLGAVSASPIESAMGSPRGIAQPCAYQVRTETELEAWTFDFDCRDNMKQRADALFAQYTKTSAELVKAFNEAADAGIKPTDAGVVVRPPEDAIEVQVGTKALDHHGRGLLFIDDDAPCYVRVLGPDAARRLALAQHVAKHLTFMNAPMTPRPAP